MVSGSGNPVGSSVVLERLNLLPKAELHVHLDGSVRPETLLELGRAGATDLPARDLPELTRYMVAPPGGSLPEYLRRFEITLSVMQTAESLDRIMYELAEDLANEGVWYVEVRYSPILHTEKGLTPEQVVEATLRGAARAERDFGIRVNLILCGIRSMPLAASQTVAEVAVAFRGHGVVGFDLAGPEHGHPPAEHAAAFAIARKGDLGVTIHAGEDFGAESIRQALHECGAHRIGHGTHLHPDVNLLRYVRDFRVPLEICLTSNVQTGAAQSIGSHPLRKYFDSGLVLSLNTDNRLISGTTLINEYRQAYLHLGFSWSEMTSLALMSFEGAFLPWPEKRALLEKARKLVDDLLGGDSSAGDVPEDIEPGDDA